MVANHQRKIPARIDTGARTTAVWASEIREKNGILAWKFFAQKSEFFTGEIHETENFARQIVRTSTGHQQIRYLIPITLQMKKRRVRTFCTLADRATQTFPILIGRNTLSGKFVVDVQKGSRKLSEIDKTNFNEMQAQLN